MQSCMCWGVECGDGWNDLLTVLCEQITQYENEKESEYFKVRFDQIKEKYGGLRVYFSGGDEYIEGLVAMAEALSYKTCEVCGGRGKVNDKGWIATLCDTCRSKS